MKLACSVLHLSVIVSLVVSSRCVAQMDYETAAKGVKYSGYTLSRTEDSGKTWIPYANHFSNYGRPVVSSIYYRDSIHVVGGFLMELCHKGYYFGDSPAETNNWTYRDTVCPNSNNFADWAEQKKRFGGAILQMPRDALVSDSYSENELIGFNETGQYVIQNGVRSLRSRGSNFQGYPILLRAVSADRWLARSTTGWFVSTDRCLSWSRVKNIPPFTNLLFTAKGVGYGLWDLRSIWVTLDSGSHWVAYEQPRQSMDRAFIYVDSNVAYTTSIHFRRELATASNWAYEVLPYTAFSVDERIRDTFAVELTLRNLLSVPLNLDSLRAGPNLIVTPDAAQVPSYSEVKIHLKLNSNLDTLRDTVHVWSNGVEQTYPIVIKTVYTNFSTTLNLGNVMVGDSSAIRIRVSDDPRYLIDSLVVLKKGPFFLRDIEGAFGNVGFRPNNSGNFQDTILLFYKDKLATGRIVVTGESFPAIPDPQSTFYVDESVGGEYTDMVRTGDALMLSLRDSARHWTAVKFALPNQHFQKVPIGTEWYQSDSTLLSVGLGGWQMNSLTREDTFARFTAAVISPTLKELWRTTLDIPARFASFRYVLMKGFVNRDGSAISLFEIGTSSSYAYTFNAQGEPVEKVGSPIFEINGLLKRGYVTRSGTDSSGRNLFNLIDDISYPTRDPEYNVYERISPLPDGIPRDHTLGGDYYSHKIVRTGEYVGLSTIPENQEDFWQDSTYLDRSFTLSLIEPLASHKFLFVARHDNNMIVSSVSNGQIIWQQANTPSYPFPHSLLIDPEKSGLLLIHFPLDQSQYRLMKYSVDGQALMAYRIPKMKKISTMLLDGEGNVWLAGAADVEGVSHAALLKVENKKLSVGKAKLPEAAFEVSVNPNPSTNFLTVQFRASRERIITVSDLLGKQVIRATSTGAKLELNINDLEPGAYVLRSEPDGLMAKITVY